VKTKRTIGTIQSIEKFTDAGRKCKGLDLQHAGGWRGDKKRSKDRRIRLEKKKRRRGYRGGRK